MTFGFPGWTCININNEFCHGIPSDQKIIAEGKVIKNLTGHGIGRSLHEHTIVVTDGKPIVLTGEGI